MFDVFLFDVFVFVLFCFLFVVEEEKKKGSVKILLRKIFFLNCFFKQMIKENNKRKK